MSFHDYCEICKKQKGIYSCPRCNRRYCSTICYKSREHELCSETFYREWVECSLRDQIFDNTERVKMIDILKKYHGDLSDDNNDYACIEDNMSSITDRFEGINIDEAEEDVLWQNLTKDEKAEFSALVADEKKLETLIIVKQPWWTITVLNLISDVNDKSPDEKDHISPRPHFPLNVKKLSDITCKNPSTCIQFNIINVLYAYAFLFRFYNSDLRDFLEEVINALFVYAPVLTEGRNYFSLEEAVQDSIRLVKNSDPCVSLDFAKSILNDVSNILQGPVNAKPSTFVLCALHDIELLLLEAKSAIQGMDKSFKKIIMPTVKKIEYFMSWSKDFENNLCELASNIVVCLLPDLFSEMGNLETANLSKDINQKLVIEEIE